MYKGKYVTLRAFEPSDTQDSFRMMNNYENQKFMRSGIPFPSSFGDESQWVSQQTSYTRGEYQFAIEDPAGELIGRCGIIKLDWKNRCGELAIMIDEASRGHGLGKDAMQVLVRFCFREMNLHRLKVTVFAENIPAIRLYAGLGFAHEGLLKDEVFRDGKYRDVAMMGLINPAEVSA